MNKSCDVMALVIVAANCALATNFLRSQSIGESDVAGPRGLDIQVKIESISEAQVILKVGARNVGTSPVYIVTDTRRVNRSKGPYLDTDSFDPAKLICSFQFYPPNPFESFVNGTSVHLTQLAVGESHEETLKLSWPMRTTLPPFSDIPQTRVINAKSIKLIEVRIGVLPVSSSLLELISRKPPPHDAFTGMEEIKVGLTERSLYELQEVFRSNVVDITKPPAGEATSGRPLVALVHEAGHVDPLKQQ